MEAPRSKRRSFLQVLAAENTHRGAPFVLLVVALAISTPALVGLVIISVLEPSWLSTTLNLLIAIGVVSAWVQFAQSMSVRHKRRDSA